MKDSNNSINPLDVWALIHLDIKRVSRQKFFIDYSSDSHFSINDSHSGTGKPAFVIKHESHSRSRLPADRRISPWIISSRSQRVPWYSIGKRQPVSVTGRRLKGSLRCFLLMK